MFRTSLPAGRWLGVDLRLHMVLPALLLAAGAASVLETGNAARGVALWCVLLSAVLTREVARALGLVWCGLPPLSILLFPFGGVVTLSPRAPGQGTQKPGSLRSLTLLPALANFGAALLLLGFSYAAAPGVNLFLQPWISLHHLLRSAVWIQIVIGAMNLLPAAMLPSRQLLRSRSGHLPRLTAHNAGPAFALGSSLGIALMLAGFVLMNLWFVLLGCLALLSAQLRGGHVPDAEEAALLPVRELMLTRYETLANSEILSEALSRTAEGAQDVYPVLQGEFLVGAITRATMARSLRAEGDGSVQRDMQRRLPLAGPEENLGDALRRAAALGGGGFVPVVQEGHVLGILTPQSLARALDKRGAASTTPRAETLAPGTAEAATTMQETPRP